MDEIITEFMMSWIREWMRINKWLKKLMNEEINQ